MNVSHDVIAVVCAKYDIDLECFLGSARTERLMACRAEVVQTLRRKGYTWEGIGSLMGRKRKAVQRWASPSRRKADNLRQRERYRNEATT